MVKIGKYMRKAIANICIIDRFLILFLMVLFIYTSVHLFTGAGTSQNDNTIDIIVRTSIASIFGYFISSNFTKTQSDPGQEHSVIPASSYIEGSENDDRKPTIKNQIGFLTSKASSETGGNLSFTPNTDSANLQPVRLQIYLVSIIGLTSLGILIIARHMSVQSPEITAIVSQLRDFVSASIGFLISCTKRSG